MKTLTIGFSYPRKFKIGAWLIKKWINKPYSHVYMRYTDDQGRDLIFHAAHGLVHLINFDNFFAENSLVREYKIEATEEQYQQFRDYYYSKLGLPYSYKAILLMPLYDLGILKKVEDDSGYICSESAGEVLSSIFNTKFKKEKNLLRPDDIEGSVNVKLD